MSSLKTVSRPGGFWIMRSSLPCTASTDSCKSRSVGSKVASFRSKHCTCFARRASAS
eukprot:CAMPEP_0198589138 /NCGR_PEP_ID=MMETSP1462-20131121/134005_1 /TAXON_ID=1333877 /ORGANISM="Brandtodinium nutriculum, Strain RCC3387" /LENGTH=56 /DNA_ID=CAMNT_0044320649 /DNA_START=94 /DNA_END=261 /DNA_ORIENTATION=+